MDNNPKTKLEKTIVVKSAKLPQIIKKGKTIQEEKVIKEISKTESLKLPSIKNPFFELKKEKKSKIKEFDYIISIGQDLLNSEIINKAGLSNRKMYLFDMISNLTLRKAVAMIHPKLNSTILFNGYNIKTQMTRLHNVKIFNLKSENNTDEEIMNILKEYYDKKLKEMHTLMFSGKKILFVFHGHKNVHKYHIHEFINTLTKRYPMSNFHLLTCNCTNTTNTRHTNIEIKDEIEGNEKEFNMSQKATDEYIDYLKKHYKLKN